MAVVNNASQIKRELIAAVSRLFLKGRLEEDIHHLVYEMYPKSKASFRCCIHKDRAVVRYRLMAILGIGIEEEKDEATPLNDYAKAALARKRVTGPVLTVIDEACSSCVKVNYFVTNACRGCVARPCIMNCPKKAISIQDQHAEIDPEKCLNCGICQKACPYHAIIYVPIPCEEACPVGAIAQDAGKRERIDPEKCISCGKCVQECPFGAIMDKSQIIDLLKARAEGRKLAALVAPAVSVQFREGARKLYGALEKAGFSIIAETAAGADETAREEAEEWKAHTASGGFMTTSCCPAYTRAVDKHIPELRPHVSHTPSPMVLIARRVRKEYPGAATVFIGPCIAKKEEGLAVPEVDFVLTVEEMVSLLDAMGIKIADSNLREPDVAGSSSGQGFGAAQGVIRAIERIVPEGLKPVSVNGLSKANMKTLMNCSALESAGNFIEVMACEGGCVAGPSVLENPKVAGRKLGGE